MAAASVSHQATPRQSGTGGVGFTVPAPPRGARLSGGASPGRGAAEPRMQRLGLHELGLDLEQLGVRALTAAEPPGPLLADLLEALGLDRQADDFRPVDLEERRRRRDALHHRHVRRLVAEVAEVHRERRLRLARDADEDDVGVVEGGPHAVAELDTDTDPGPAAAGLRLA